MLKFLAGVIYCYVCLVFYTSRKHMVGYQSVLDNAAQHKRQIFLFWHGRIALMAFLKPKVQDTYLVASRHRDGQLIAALMRYFNIIIIEGSSRRKGSNKDRGGRKALLEAIQRLNQSYALAITPDGPRGPRMRLGGHIVDIAKKTGAEIIPISFSSTRGILFNSWDRFFLPLPFGRVHYFIGKPVPVPQDATDETVEKIRQHLEERLNDLTREVDAIAGRKITPEPVES